VAEARSRADAAQHLKAAEDATLAAGKAKEAADALRTSADALRTASGVAKAASETTMNAFTVADKDIAAKADAANALLDEARQYDVSTDEEGSQRQPPSPLLSVAQQLGDSQGTQGGTTPISVDLYWWEKPSQQSSNLNISQGHGQAMDPGATSTTLSQKQAGSTALPHSVSTDSAGSNQGHPQGAQVEETSSASVINGVSSIQGNGEGKEGVEKGNAEEKSDDTAMSTTLEGNNKPLPPPPTPPPPLPPLST
jgi:hypothetical protein